MSTRRFLASVGTPIALLALFAALQQPVLFLYYGGLIVLAIGASGFVAAHHFRGQRNEAREDARRLEAECNAHAATNAALVAEAALTDPATGTSVRVPLLTVVKPPVADESWLDEITKPGGWS